VIVAIDGPAGVGKSSIASQIADEWSYFNLNSGNFYRAITLKSLQNGISIDRKDKIIEIGESCEIAIKDFRLHLDGNDVEDLLHSDEIDALVAQVSAIIPVRHIVNTKLRVISKSLNIVAEGRDMTTVVFPDAEVKIFLDASPEIRAKRRFDQGVSQLSYEEILDGIVKRDIIDRNKEEGSLKVSGDALYLDTSSLTLGQVCARVSGKIKEFQ